MKKKICSVFLCLVLVGTCFCVPAYADGILRGDAILTLYRSAGEPAAEKQSPFTDVEPGSEYEPAVNWAWEKGIAKGVSDTLFALNSQCGTEECAVFLYRYAKASGLDTAIPEGTKAPEGVHPWAAEAMAWAEGKGLLAGSSASVGTAPINTFSAMLENLGVSNNKDPETVSAPPAENTESVPAGSGRRHSHKSGGESGGISVGTVQLPTYGKTYLIINPAGSYLTFDGSDFSLGAAGNAAKWVAQDAGNNRFRLRELKSWDVLTIEQNSVSVEEDEGDDSQLLFFEETGSGSAIKSVAGGVFAVSNTQEWLFCETNSGTALDFSQDGTQTIGNRTFQISGGNVEETSDYYKISTHIELPSGGYSLSNGTNYSIGMKAMYVNRALSDRGYLAGDFMNCFSFENETEQAVFRFQQDNGLYADGVVNQPTWVALGYSDADWYDVGAYVTDLKVPAYGSARGAYIDAMIDTASEYAQAGTGYAKGSAGKPGTFISDAGLVLECLYAAGISPDVTIIDHARSAYENLANNLGNDSGLGTAVSSAERGDLVFYGGGQINHVAICAGNGKVYDSAEGRGVSERNIYSPGNILKIVRVF